VASAVGRAVACCESGRVVVAAQGVLLVSQRPSKLAADGCGAAICTHLLRIVGCSPRRRRGSVVAKGRMGTSDLVRGVEVAGVVVDRRTRHGVRFVVAVVWHGRRCHYYFPELFHHTRQPIMMQDSSKRGLVSIGAEPFCGGANCNKRLVPDSLNKAESGCPELSILVVGVGILLSSSRMQW